MNCQIHFAPIQGVTDRLYRNLHKKYFGGVDFYYTPFIRVEHGNEFRTKDLRDISLENEQVKNLIPQILGGDVEEMKMMLNMLREQGFHEVNINLGCPFPMIVRKGKGAGILAYPEKVEPLLEMIQDFPMLRCSVKMRLGWKDVEEGFMLLPLLNRSSLSSIIVHARLGVDGYKGEVDHRAFQHFYERCELPLLYNGDLCSIDEVQQVCVRYPRLAGVMVGRGLLADPALALACKQGTDLDDVMKKKLFRLFHDELVESNAERLEGDHQLLMRMKTFWEYFMPGVDQKLLKKIRKTNRWFVYKEIVNEIFRFDEK